MAIEKTVKDMVVLVVDKKHPRYGQIGEMLYHDWREFGIIEVEFLNGEKEEFYDGIMKGDSPSKIQAFYRHLNDIGTKEDLKGVGPASFQKKYLEHGHLETLIEEYKILFGEDLPKIKPEEIYKK